MASNTLRYQKAAAALRANLKRRKAQARARAETGHDGNQAETRDPAQSADASPSARTP